MQRKYLYIVYLLTLCLIFVFIVHAVNQLVITNQGSFVQTKDVESDITSINWGTLQLNSTTNRTVQFRRIGNTDVTLNITTQNWVPNNATNYLTFSNNYQGQTVSTSWFPVVFTLTVASNVSTLSTFSFEIVVVAQ